MFQQEKFSLPFDRKDFSPCKSLINVIPHMSLICVIEIS